MEKTVREYEGEELKPKKKTTSTHNTEIPIWIRQHDVPEDRSDIPLDQLTETDADIWLSITELRRSDIEVSCSKSHDFEWLACGAIPTRVVTKVMPFDGRKLHGGPSGNPVKVYDGQNPWVFDWVTWMWRLEEDMNAAANARKNRHSANDNDEETQSNKRRKLQKDGAVTEKEGTETSPEQRPGTPCPTCGCSCKSSSIFVDEI
jgi:hypothetical protein